jgi:heme-degrading monooxygenase HmoA
MIAVIFEVEPHVSQAQAYLDAARILQPHLESVDGFVSVERFESLLHPGKLLSLSFWRDETGVETWRNLDIHREAQRAGREQIFANYRLRVARVTRDYGLNRRTEAPEDSRIAHPRSKSCLDAAVGAPASS